MTTSTNDIKIAPMPPGYFWASRGDEFIDLRRVIAMKVDFGDTEFGGCPEYLTEKEHYRNEDGELVYLPSLVHLNGDLCIDNETGEVHNVQDGINLPDWLSRGLAEPSERLAGTEAPAAGESATTGKGEASAGTSDLDLARQVAAHADWSYEFNDYAGRWQTFASAGCWVAAPDSEVRVRTGDILQKLGVCANRQRVEDVLYFLLEVSVEDDDDNAGGKA